MSEEAILAGGCFWCLEACFQRVRGVESVEPGYAGGWMERPGYQDVCRGGTGHAEAVRIVFDPSQIEYRRLLRLFFAMHDPTTRNRQGADVGEQYRSAIFYRNEAQRRIAEETMAEVEREGWLPGPIVTELAPAGAFYEAEAEHRSYYERHPDAAYCRFVIAPKLAHLPEGERRG